MGIEKLVDPDLKTAKILGSNLNRLCGSNRLPMGKLLWQKSEE